MLGPCFWSHCRLVTTLWDLASLIPQGPGSLSWLACLSAHPVSWPDPEAAAHHGQIASLLASQSRSHFPGKEKRLREAESLVQGYTGRKVQNWNLNSGQSAYAKNEKRSFRKP